LGGKNISFSVLLSCVLAIAGQHVNADDSGSAHIELWQAINLIGAPLLALLFVQPVIEDVKAWLRRDS
jgi:hypothetical protein